MYILEFCTKLYCSRKVFIQIQFLFQLVMIRYMCYFEAEHNLCCIGWAAALQNSLIVSSDQVVHRSRALWDTIKIYISVTHVHPVDL